MAYTKIFFILFALFPAYVHAGQSETITISAIVPPMRYVIVDSSFQIKEITSNSPTDIHPVAKLNSAEGVSIPWNTSIEKQYNSLLPHLNFSQPGVIYTHPYKQSLLVDTLSQFKQLLNCFI